MKRSCIFVILFATIASRAFIGLSFAQSETDTATKSKIAALEELWYEAFKTRDTQAIDSILDNSVLLVNSDGSVQTKGDCLASLKVRFSQATALQPHWTPESLSVRVFGTTTAIAMGVYQIKGVERGKPFQRRERFLDTWKFRAGSWVIVGTQATPVLH